MAATYAMVSANNRGKEDGVGAGKAAGGKGGTDRGRGGRRISIWLLRGQSIWYIWAWGGGGGATTTLE